MDSEQAKQAEKDLINDFKKVFTTDEGKRVQAAIDQFCGYDTSYLSPVMNERPQGLGFVLGMREVAWHIKCQLVRNPDVEQQTEIEDQGTTLN